MGYFDGIRWFDLLQSAGIIGSFLFAAYSTRKDNQARKISHLYATADRHREIWKSYRDRPTLSRVLEKTADLSNQPLSHEEELFVTGLIIHLDTVYRAMKAGMFVELEGLRTDMKEFFLLPVPKAVWQKYRPLRDAEFIEFVEGAWEG
jgi:hypothetical protein